MVNKTSYPPNRKLEPLLHVLVCFSLLGVPDFNPAPQNSGMQTASGNLILEPNSQRNHAQAPTKGLERGGFTLSRRALTPVYSGVLQTLIILPRIIKPKLVTLGRLQLEGG